MRAPSNAVAVLAALVTVVAACDSGTGIYRSAATSEGGTPIGVPAPPAALIAIPIESIKPDDKGAARIQEDVNYLASNELGGRRTGEEGARLASEFIAKRFGDLGLLPFGDAETKGDTHKRSFFYRFSPGVNAKVDPPELDITTDGSDHSIPVASLRTADGAASAEVTGDAVFVGWGVSDPDWDDYAGADVEGKIAVVLRGSPKIPKRTESQLYALATFRTKIKAARAHKAVGLLVVSGTDVLPPGPSDPRDLGLPAVVMTRSAALNLFPGLGVENQTAWAATKPVGARALSGTRIRLKTHVESMGKFASDVVAMIPAYYGSKTADEWVVIGGHYDHVGMGGAESMTPWVHAIHPGADDNASGTALVMEVARRLEALPRRPARNVICITFAGEEEGLLGSAAWVDNPPIEMSHVTAMLNADMVGRLRKNHLIVLGTSTSPRWGPIFDRGDEGLGLEMGSDSGEDLSDRSDQASFHAQKVPIAFLFTGMHPDYHRPSDTPDKINAAGIESIATLAARVVLEVAEEGLGPPPKN